MVKSKRMMETDKKTRIKRQFMPVTHASAVLGLKEFIQGNFFQADFDRVMGMLQEHYDKASAEIDQKAEKIEKYANEKIAEFDGKLSDSNKRMTALEKEIQETQQIIEENDIPTRQEMSANVINQIGGAESAILKKELLADGTEGTAARDNNGVLEPFNQSDYDDLNNPEGYVRSETLINGRGAEIEFKFDVIGTLEKKYPFLFEGFSSMAEKIGAVNKILKSMSLVSTYRGGGVNSSSSVSLNFARWNILRKKATSTAALEYSTVNLTADFKNYEISLNNMLTSNIRDEGNTVLYLASKKNGNSDNGAISDGVTPAWIEVKDIRLTVELEVNGRTIIEEMIAAYHREMGLSNLVFKKVGEV